MKQIKSLYTTLKKLPILTLLLSSWGASSSFGQTSSSRAAADQLLDQLPVQMSFSSFLIIGGLLVASVILFFLYQRRSWKAERELRALGDELNHTRSRLTEIGQQLEDTQGELRMTNDRYLGILYSAEMGMFQTDLEGKCTYLNGRMEKLSGLYPKKALKQGLICAMHPDDKKKYEEAWEAFTGKKNQPFNINVRFVHAKGREVLVNCTANKVFNDHKEVESYIGWVADVTPFHEQCCKLETDKEQYQHFIEETIEGFYQLVPKKPISLKLPKEKLANAILEEMQLESCNDTFAALYGATPRSLRHKQIGAIPGGCGLFRNQDDVLQFMANEYQTIGIETVRQDPRGNRLNLSNSVIGLIHDNHLVGIWGSQRNVSREKRAIAALSSQTEFMQKVLNALPADVFVKDTRCRYLYVSEQQAQNTGIPEEDWIGKTIFEVIPGTPRDADTTSISVMKKKKLCNTVTPYELKGKTRWVENIQIPLVSEEGLVEGVVGMAIDITERKAKEEKLERFNDMTTKRLEARDAELREEKKKHTETALELQDASRKLRLQEMEFDTQQKQFNLQLDEYKAAESLLQQSKDDLQTRQMELEQQLTRRLDEICISTEKQKRAEVAQQSAEESRKEIEEIARRRAQQLDTEMDRREKAEAELHANREELERLRTEFETLTRRRENEIAELQDRQKRELAVITGQQEHALSQETSARKTAEKQLHRTEDNLQKTEAHLNLLTEQHREQLEAECAKRGETESQLAASTEELNRLRRNFNLRIEEETKALKQELANKQIREKALRENEKELNEKIRKQEEEIRSRNADVQDQIKAREAADLNVQQVEKLLEQLNVEHAEQLNRTTEKLKQETADARQAEEQLRLKLESLEQNRRELENTLQQRNSELSDAIETQHKQETKLEQSRQELAQLREEQAQAIQQQTAALRKEIEDHITTEQALRDEQNHLNKMNDQLQETIRHRESELQTAAKERKQTESELKEIRIRFELNRKNTTELIKESKQALEAKLETHKHTEQELGQAAQDLKEYALELRKEVAQKTEELTAETAKREGLEKRVHELKEELEEARIDGMEQARLVRQELEQKLTLHTRAETDLQKSEAELKSIIAQLNGQMEQRTGELEREANRRTALEEELAALQQKLENQRAEAREQLQQTREELESKLKTAQQQEAILQKAEAELKDQLEDLEHELSCTTQDLEEEAERIQSLKNAQKQQLQMIRNKDRQLQEHQAKSSIALRHAETKAELALEEQSELHRKKELELANAGQDMLMQVNALDGQLSRKTAEYEAECSRREALEKELAEQKIALQASRQNLDSSVNESLAKLESEIAEHQRKETILQTTEQALREQMADMEAQIRERSSTLAEESAQRVELENKLQRLEKELQDARASLESSIEKANEPLNRRIDELEQLKKELQHQEIALNTQVNRLEAEVAQRVEQLQQAEQARQQAEQTLRQKIEETGLSSSQTEQRIEELRAEHAAAIQTLHDEEKELRDAERHYRTLFSSAPEAILLINPNSLTIHSANPAAATLFGAASTDSLNETALDALSAPRQADAEISVAAIKPHLETALKKGPTSFEWSFQRADEEGFPGLTSLSTIGPENEPQVMAIIHDISPLKQQQTNLEKALNEAQQANRKNTRLVDDVSDAVQTALTPAIKTTEDETLTANLTEEQREHIGHINHSSRYLIDMMKYRSTICHLADGSDPMAAEPASLHELLRDIDQRFSRQAEEKKLFFALSYAQQDTEHNLPRQVETDIEKVRYTLTTLLNYSMNSTQKGRLGLHASRTETAGEQVQIAFELAFTASQKEDPLLSKIFDAEHFDENHCTPETDLDLSLARRYARLLGGDVILEYRAAGVTSLTFHLGCRNLDEMAATEQTAIGAA